MYIIIIGLFTLDDTDTDTDTHKMGLQPNCICVGVGQYQHFHTITYEIFCIGVCSICCIACKFIQ